MTTSKRSPKLFYASLLPNRLSHCDRLKIERIMTVQRVVFPWDLLEPRDSNNRDSPLERAVSTSTTEWRLAKSQTGTSSGNEASISLMRPVERTFARPPPKSFRTNVTNCNNVTENSITDQRRQRCVWSYSAWIDEQIARKTVCLSKFNC